jgi:hypothetical protein
MKKIWTILILGMLIIGMTSVSASLIPKTEKIRSRSSSSVVEKIDDRIACESRQDGNFSGMFAKKNESGYVMLGSLEGTYNMSSNNSGSFEGIWDMTDENVSGTFNGWFWGSFILGKIDQDAGNSSWFIGLYRVNTTSNEFGAVALIFSAPCIVRYAAGTYQ